MLEDINKNKEEYNKNNNIIYCPNCGNANKNDANFCKYCGTKNIKYNPKEPDYLPTLISFLCAIIPIIIFYLGAYHE